MWTKENIHELVQKQNKFFRTNKTLDLNFRKKAIIRLRDAVIRHEDDLKEALYKDLGRHGLEAYFCDIGTVVLEANETLKGLDKYAKTETHFSGLTCFPSMITKVYKMPYGTTLIISPFNFPILLSLGVLIAAISGGNTAVIKASSKTPNCTKAMQELIEEIFPSKFVAIVDGGHDVADMCLEERFDKIFYTGSPRVAKHILEMAAKNLTPVALELGGEEGNFAVVRKDADIKDAARKIAFFKSLNAGQICINVNQVAVASEVADKFIKALKKEFKRQVPNAARNKEYPKLITKAAYDKCAKTAKKYSDRIVYGGNGSRRSRRFEPTIIYPVGLEEEIVNRELFSPLLPIIVYDDNKIDELMDNIASREHGLALYLFTKDIEWAEHIMSTQQFGGGCVNEVCLHIMVKGVPFNGTGHSGMGAYHGEWGFREFTHPQTVLYGSTHFNLPMREHPYEKRILKEKFIKLFEK